MGTSLRHLHVYVQNLPMQDVSMQIASAVEQSLQQRGYETTTEERAQKSVRIVSDASSSWISIYIHKSLGDLAELEWALSQIGQPTLKIEVHDSDVLDLRLWIKGQEVDRFSDWANYDQFPRKQVGDATKWAKALPALISAEALQKAWTHLEADYPFQSEGALYRVIKLLNLEEWRMWAGKWSEDIPDSAQVRDLYFRYSDVRHS